MERLPIVAVLGSAVDEHDDLARPLGRWLGGLGVHLLTGGGGGVMAAVSRAFHAVPGRHGLVIGVLPGEAGHTLQGYPNPWVEIPIATHLPLSGAQGTDAKSRNHINVLSADVIVVMAGRAGTSSEAHLAIVYRKPIAAFVHNQSDIPDLAPEVPVCTTLDAIKAFVMNVLKPGPRPVA
ncbi:MAG: hypothetical protein QF463_02725 [Vicinamibacterales bacterium]|jgi:uncharacterized protein (TIGR00725 family)|nr:hypothetical protein [Acidobacteriota bacterium]MDP6371152.1 hypothetical protein [Vicinamibacterales bacterium]MDP6607957.1 hypothetical protein [Vicinamibacterales bacterium]|tara:strand:- start:2069 stop:2605 length:537 start_codon:yes stop_codon:yes gene_type:complete